MKPLVFLSLFLIVSIARPAVISDDIGHYYLPLTCSELLPDPMPYLKFFDSMARGIVNKDKKTAKRLFLILAYRQKMASSEKEREQNPVDYLIRKTLCFYREQKEPIKAVPYDDDKLRTFIKAGLTELETKVKESIFNYEFEQQQKKVYEEKIKDSQFLSDRLKDEVDEEAEKEVKRIVKSARNKVHRK